MDPVAQRFFDELRARRLSTTKCNACGSLRYPPRAWCPDCMSDDLDWVTLSGNGTLSAFSTQETALRFRAPDVIGLVDLDEGVRVLSHIVGRYEDLTIGDRVAVDFVEVEAGLVLHRFTRED